MASRLFYRLLPVLTAWLLILPSVPSLAQFPVTLQLDARSGDIVATPPTSPTARYRITVTGTYSQWPQFTDCHGVDAVWVYDVPQEEIDAFRWPPRTLLGRPFVEIPHWVGDTTEYVFPPRGSGPPPLFEISFRKYLGFRVNGEPLPPTTLDPTFHRYQQELAGTGEEIRFQILDSTFNIALGRVIPRYEDNCGMLSITVEEILETDVTICDAQPVVVNGEVVGIRIDAGVFKRDTTAVDGRRNLLSSAEQIGIVVDGKFVCPDSLICAPTRTTPLSIGLLVDVSGSMAEQVMYDGRFVTRLQAVKNTLHTFLGYLQPKDSVFLMSFSEEVWLDRNWTTDTGAIGRAVDALVTLGGTALHQAMINAIEKVRVHQRPNRILIALTDGLNNRQPENEDVVLRAIRAANIPLYLVALGFTNVPEEQLGLAAMQRFVAAAPRGKLYVAQTGDELSAAYTELATTIETEDCCELYFRIPPCDRGQSKRTLKLVYVDGENIVTTQLLVDCDLRTVSVDDEWDSESDHAYQTRTSVAQPTPASDEATISYIVPAAGAVHLRVHTMDGHAILSRDLGFQDAGVYSTNIDVQHWAPGMYVCQIQIGSRTVVYKVLVQH